MNSSLYLYLGSLAVINKDYRGFTVVRCSNVDRAWKTLEWFNREYPQYRVTFITSSYEYEQVNK
jgi:hypothetical protein